MPTLSVAQHFVKYHRTDVHAPLREPARVTEVKGKKRAGVGVAYRLYGPHGVVLGRWLTRQERAAEIQRARDLKKAGDDGWGRVMEPEEIWDLLAHPTVAEKVTTGWNPATWHWRWYLERLEALASRWGLVDVAAYNERRWTPLRALQTAWSRIRPPADNQPDLTAAWDDVA